MKGYPNWPNKPKSLSERGYRKFMAKQKKVTVNGEEYTLSPSLPPGTSASMTIAA